MMIKATITWIIRGILKLMKLLTFMHHVLGDTYIQYFGVCYVINIMFIGLEQSPVIFTRILER